jgi:steroid delta-isomerase-like uncharacterized protein
MMTRDEMKALMIRCHAAIGNHDLDALAGEHAEHCVMDSPTAGGTAAGREAIARVYETWFHAFPDLQVSEPDIIIDGERAAMWFTASGTDTGGFIGLPPTGRRFRVPMVFIHDVADGKITHARPLYDFSGLLIQLGVLKVKAV